MFQLAVSGQMLQQGSKLVASDAIGMSQQGVAVALSADGNTALVGGDGDNNNVGAAWVFTRSGGAWREQAKLVGNSVIGAYAFQGIQVALSGDGNTAIVGGTGDSQSIGAAWVFVRSGSTWSQQAKLVGTGAIGQSYQGFRVALSGDGNTALVSGSGDDGNTGATWVFTRSNGTWSQQGNKLIGTGAAGSAFQGWSVALSADGNTAISSGVYDNNETGAAWVFARSNGAWTQQGPKLVGTGAAPGKPWEGWSVALSADGNEAVLQGTPDDGSAGCLWTFTRSNGVWTQRGNKVVTSGVGYTIPTHQGHSVAVSADGTIALMGGNGDYGLLGAAWMYSTSNGALVQQQKLVGAGSVGTSQEGYSVALSADGRTAILGGPQDNNWVGGVWIFSGAPQISSGGVVNGGSFQPVLAPGTDATIFGSHFAAIPTSASSVPFPYSLGGVSVTVNGTPAPVFYADSGQINFQVPYEIAVGTASVVVSVNGVPSAAVPVTITAAAPGILFLPGNQAVTQNQDYSINGAANPAKVGSYVTLYLVGGGAATPAVNTGMAASASPLSTFDGVSVTIGGAPANVVFAGLTPGSVGLMQVNLQIPDLPAGNHAVKVTVGSGVSNTPTIAVTQ